MASMTENDFLNRYNDPDREITVIDLDSPKYDGRVSPYVIVRYQGKTLILNPLALSDHLCVDAHAFVNGKDATTGVMAMSSGKRWELPSTGTTSHEWNSANLIALLLGEQNTA